MLGLLAVGHTNAEIAALLVVSRRTVESYRTRLYQKLGRRTRAELVQSARTLGLAELVSSETPSPYVPVRDEQNRHARTTPPTPRGCPGLVDT